MPLTRSEATAFLRKYRKAMRINIDHSSSLSDLFSKILVHPDMYDELTFGLEIPKKHVVLFEGTPLQACPEMPYGTIFYVPKFMTVEISNIKSEAIN